MFELGCAVGDTPTEGGGLSGGLQQSSKGMEYILLVLFLPRPHTHPPPPPISPTFK